MEQTLTAPTAADSPITVRYNDRLTTGTTLAVIPLSNNGGYRVPVRLSTDPPEYVTVVFIAQKNPDDTPTPPFLLPHPQEWHMTSGVSLPLVCELRPGDTLHPSLRQRPGRPSEHLDPQAPTPQVVLSVTRESDGRVSVQTRDGVGQMRRFKRDVEETMDVNAPTKRPPYARRQIPGYEAVRSQEHPAVFDGPYVSSTGAQYVFQQPSTRGGRPKRSEPRYDEFRPPMFAENGDLIPYIMIGPRRTESFAAIKRSIATFSPTARKLPEVQAIIERYETP